MEVINKFESEWELAGQLDKIVLLLQKIQWGPHGYCIFCDCPAGGSHRDWCEIGRALEGTL